MERAHRWAAATAASIMVAILLPAQAQAAPVTGSVRAAAGSSLNVRSGLSSASVVGTLRINPPTQLRPVGTILARASLAVSCQVIGDTVAGSARTTSRWDRLINGRFVLDADFRWSGSRPTTAYCQLGRGVAPAPGTPFVQWAAPYAQASMRDYKVPASVIIAQAILESGWGGSGLAKYGNAMFGMKCFGTPGTIATGCRPFATTECSGTYCYPATANFRVYTSVDASFSDHGNQLATLSRYRAAMKYLHNPDQFARELQKAGYATDPSYAAILISLMKKYDLYRYDIAGPRCEQAFDQCHQLGALFV